MCGTRWTLILPSTGPAEVLYTWFAGGGYFESTLIACPVRGLVHTNADATARSDAVMRPLIDASRGFGGFDNLDRHTYTNLNIK